MKNLILLLISAFLFVNTSSANSTMECGEEFLPGLPCFSLTFDNCDDDGNGSWTTLFWCVGGGIFQVYTEEEMAEYIQAGNSIEMQGHIDLSSSKENTCIAVSNSKAEIQKGTYVTIGKHKFMLKPGTYPVKDGKIYVNPQK